MSIRIGSFPWFAAGLVLCTMSAGAQLVVQFEGSSDPSAQGWTANTNATPPDPFFNAGSFYDMDTLAYASGTPSTLFLWSKDVGIDVADGFAIEWSLLVIDNPTGHNPFDAPIAFMAQYQGGPGLPADREQMIYFDTNRVGWADNSASVTMDTTDTFHTYRLEVDTSGNASVFIDGTLAFTRTGFTTNGVIAFGDQTNDAAVDAHFQMNYVATSPTGCPGDLDGDGDVDGADLAVLLGGWGLCP